MTLKRLKKKKDRAKSQAKIIIHSQKYLSTPVDKDRVNEIFVALKEEDNRIVGAVNGKVTSGLDDSRLMQIATAIAVIEFHIPKLPYNLRAHISESRITSNFMNFDIKGIDLIPDDYKEVATWGNDDYIFYSNDKVRGTFLTVYKSMVRIDEKDRAKLEEAESFIDED